MLHGRVGHTSSLVGEETSERKAGRRGGGGEVQRKIVDIRGYTVRRTSESMWYGHSPYGYSPELIRYGHSSELL
jgi:hypothetical protein